jgi:hypothetical protein
MASFLDPDVSVAGRGCLLGGAGNPIREAKAGWRGSDADASSAGSDTTAIKQTVE